MTPRYRMTPFARLLIFLIIFVPIVLIGMDVYNGGDSLNRVKTFFNDKLKSKPTEMISKDRYGIQTGTNEELINAKSQEIRELKTRIEQLEREIDRLK